MRPVEIYIDKKRLTFNSITDFEFCLDARTAVPARKVAELLHQPLDLLRAEARSIRELERRFTDILAKAIDNPTLLSEQMHQLDKHLFSQGFRWRSIMEAVNALPHKEHQFRRIAMVRYLQYLRSRQDALCDAYEKLHQCKTPKDDLQQDTPAMRETAIFNLS